MATITITAKRGARDTQSRELNTLASAFHAKLRIRGIAPQHCQVNEQDGDLVVEVSANGMLDSSEVKDLFAQLYDSATGCRHAYVTSVTVD